MLSPKANESIPETGLDSKLIEQSRLDLQAQLTERYRRLMELTVAINESHHLDEVLRLVRNTVVEACGFDRAGIFLFDPVHRVMRGAWGTDREGNLEDLRNESFSIRSEDEAIWGIGGEPTPGYIYTNDFSELHHSSPSDPMYGVRTSGLVHLRTNDTTVGVIAVDNLLTARPIAVEDLQELIPFANQAAIAIEKARLLEERERTLTVQRRLMEMATSIAAGEDPDRVFRLVRDAVLETGIVDRVSVWYVEGDKFRGTWGTTPAGEVIDEHERHFAVTPDVVETLQRHHPYFFIDTKTVVLPDASSVHDVPFAVLALRCSDELVGMLTADNLRTMRPLAQSNLEPLMPLAEQSAIAIQKARHLSDQRRLIRQQQRLMQMATVISGNDDLSYIFRLVREAVLETGVVDRAGGWMIDGDHFQGTWGTSATGELVDERDVRYTLEHSTAVLKELDENRPSVSVRYQSVKLPSGEMRHDVPYAVIGLRASNELVGVLTVDTLFTMRPITIESLQPLLPFAEHAAIAIQKVQLLEERARIVRRQQRLMQVAAAITSFKDLDTLYSLIREAIRESGWIDRVSVWTIEGSELCGTIGEDFDGHPLDLRDTRYRIEDCSSATQKVIRDGVPYAIDHLDVVRSPEGEERQNVPHAAIALSARGELHGIISIDTFESRHSISPADLELLLPFADQTAIAISNAKLERQISERNRSLAESQAESLERLARAAAYKDDATGAHTARIRDYCRLIGEAMGLDADQCDLLQAASELHDLGKIGIPDAILNKPGPLTELEFAVVKQHPTIGADLLAGGKSELIRSAEVIAASHHERWDGHGYPSGLRGEEIPLFARIVAVADVLDALTSQRPYKPPWPFDDAISEIEQGSGAQFDPAVVTALLECRDQVEAAFNHLAKTPPTSRSPWLDTDCPSA